MATPAQKTEGQRRYDLIVVGGGMVGASLVRALAGLGLRIAVAEAFPLAAAEQPSYDDRAIALAYGTREVLRGLGLWEALRPAAEPIERIHVSDRGRFGATRLRASDQGVPALGYVVSGHSLGQALLGGLADLPGVDLFCPATFESMRETDHGIEVRLRLEDRPLTLSASLLAAADGRESRVRALLGIGAREWTYGQTALICNLHPAAPQPRTAFERFTETGPMALLPMTGGRYGLVWTLEDAQVTALSALDEASFLQRVQQRFGWRLGRFAQAGPRTAYPLRLLLAERSSGPRTLLLGNAAHAVHPITGQGFNLGIRDVACLADLIADARRAQADLGAPQLLAAYEAQRRPDQERIATVTDALVRLFTNPLWPVRMTRALGLTAMDWLPPLKRGLAHRFMGLDRASPRLSRGLPVD